ncbi:MAG: type II toxin-antitoxin system Phd/YefM family antitoxin [Chlamydiia bacterium]|nr:type II toxin-antitoxin system Phd/YefM family antitoxin [Chlamydiia bacterium]
MSLENSKDPHYWQVGQAKAHFSELMQSATQGVQIVTKHGQPIAAVLSFERYQKLAKPKQSFLDAFRACPYPDLDMNFSRSKDLPRDIDL